MQLFPPSSARNRVLQAALEVFSAKGYHEATMDEVARQAQVSKGALYLYFPSKQALFAALVEAGVDVLLTTMRQAMKPHTSHRKRMYAAIEASFSLLEEYRTLARLIFLRLGSNPLLERKILEAHQRISSLIEEELRAACSAENVPQQNFALLALMWTGAIYEILVWWLYQEDPPQLVNLVEPLYSILLRTLGPRLSAEVA